MKVICCVVVILLSSIASLSGQTNNYTNLISKSNANKYIEIKSDFLKKLKLKYLDEEGSIKLNVDFVNNPYKLTGDYSLIIVFKNIILFDGIFKTTGVFFNVPKQLLNISSQFKIIIYKKKNFFIFGTDQEVHLIRENDNVMNIIFMPTNDAESVYIETEDWRRNYGIMNK